MTAHEQFTVDTARSAADDGDLARWVAEFLASDGSDNAALGAMLETDYPIWFGPVELPFDQLHRLAGPPDQPALEPLGDDDLETVDKMQDSLDEGWTPPPFVVTWQGDHFVLEDGNHRIEGLRRSGLEDYWCVVGCADEAVRRAIEEDRRDGSSR